MAKKIKPFRVAVIGCVESAEKHIAALSAAPETKIVALCDVNRKAVKKFKKKYKIRRGYKNYMRMLRRCLFRRRPDAVHICMPSASRAAIASYCMMKKCHVMLEPPMAFDAASAADAVATAAYMGKRCGVLLPARSNATTAYVREMLASGRLGRILSARSVISAAPSFAADRIYDADFTDKTAACLLFSVAAPAIDLVDLMVNADFTELSCSMANRAHAGATPADSVEGVITYASGVKHSFYCTSNYENGGSSQISLLCENGEIVFDADDVRITYADGTKDEMHDENPAMACLDQVRDFYVALREGRAPITEADASARLHTLMLALHSDAMASGISYHEVAKPSVDTKPRLWY